MIRLKKIPDEYGHPSIITVFVDLGPGVLDHHSLPVSQMARPLQVVQLSFSLHPLHLETQWCGAEHVHKAGL